jgi:hypothetical protein
MSMDLGVRQDMIAIPIAEALPVLVNRSEQQRRDTSVIVLTDSSPGGANEMLLTLEFAAAMTQADVICCHGTRAQQRMLARLQTLGNLAKEKFGAVRFPQVNLVAMPPSVDTRHWKQVGKARNATRHTTEIDGTRICIGLDWSVLERAGYEGIDARRLVVSFMEVGREFTLLLSGCCDAVSGRVATFTALMSRHAPAITVKQLGVGSQERDCAVAASDIWLVPAPASPQDVLPAMASGRAIVSVDWDWTLDLIEDGRTGVTIAAFAPLADGLLSASEELHKFSNLNKSITFSSIDLGERLRHLIDDTHLRERLAETAAHEMESRFDRTLAVRRYNALGDRLAEARKAISAPVSNLLDRQDNGMAEARIRSFVTAPLTPMVYLRGVGRRTHAFVADLITAEQYAPEIVPASLLTAIGNLFTAVDNWLIHDVLVVVDAGTESGMMAIQTMVRAGILSPMSVVRETPAAR